MSGNQAVQHAKAGLKAIYLSGWQVAADANTAGEMYPDQSLYPYDSAPKLVETIEKILFLVKLSLIFYKLTKIIFLN